MSQQLVTLINKVIGNQGRKVTKEDEYVYYCPECNHYKRKLQLNTTTGKFHCWVCNFGGYTLFQLFKKLNATRAQYDELSTYVQDTKPKYEPKTTVQVVKLPEAFKPIFEKSNSITRKHALKYLKYRGLSKHDIIKYNIGYCDTGEYSNRIIIPSYDSQGKLNFFVGRDIFESTMKYKNSYTPKDIVGFDLFINWDEPLILVEGVFDAMAIKRNAIPLFGTVILDQLKRKIITKNVKTVYLCLDSDAWKKSLGIIEEFLKAGIDVFNIELGEKDPSELGFESMLRLIAKTSKTSFSDLIRYKLKWRNKEKSGNTSIFDELTSLENAS